VSAAPHIVGVVGNDIVNDSRVKKVAATAAAAGYRSTIVCYTPNGTRRITRMGDVEVIRVPIPFDAQAKNRRVPAQLRPFNGNELAQRHAGPRSYLLGRRRVLETRISDAERGGFRRVLDRIWLGSTRIALKVRHEGFRIRRRGNVEIDRAVRVFNRQRVRAAAKVLGRWRDPIPNIADYEISFGPILEELRPDLIHAHDFHMIGVAVNAAERLRRSGQESKVVYDAHEWIPGLSYPQPTLRAWLRLQDRYIGAVDAVIGVSPEQIDQLAEMYSLKVRPTLVLNAPVATASGREQSNIRVDTGIGPSDRLISYHGNVQLERGLGTIIEALQYLDERFHVALLAPPGPNTNLVAERAIGSGVQDRVHIRGYVDSEDLVGYLSTADVSVIPYLPTANNDIALPNKLFEAVNAGLPVVVSNMRSLSSVVKEHGIGEVFEAGSALHLSEKVRTVIEDSQSYRARITDHLKAEMSWAAQADRLVELYANLLGRSPGVIRPLSGRDLTETAAAAEDSFRPTKLAVGPRNMAGQAFQIANAVQGNLGIPSVSFSIEKPTYRFPIHIQVRGEEWRSPEWQERQLAFLADGFTHVLTESGTGPLGSRDGGFIDDQLPALEEAGLRVAIVLHGSEIRDPRRHRELPYSPYRVDDDLTRSLEKATRRLRDRLSGLRVPVYVTTPDLLADIDATWLPAVLNMDDWDGLAEPFHRPVPRVLHMPTNGRLKGSDHVDPVLLALQAEGLIEYLRPEAGAAEEVSGLVSAADIVIDQIVIGAYGLMSCQAMAAGRLSIANVRDIGFLRDVCPIIDANPDTLESAMRALVADRSTWQERSEAGRAYAAEFHDGTATARALEEFLKNNT
jgi:glycosyltransferase involved in cell wall biosynthesis